MLGPAHDKNRGPDEIVAPWDAHTRDRDSSSPRNAWNAILGTQNKFVYTEMLAAGTRIPVFRAGFVFCSGDARVTVMVPRESEPGNPLRMPRGAELSSGARNGRAVCARP